jgi:hypothetical protein
MTQPALFPELPDPPPAEPGLSAGQRLTLRQRADVAAGRHPLTHGRLAADPAARCGNCRFRVLEQWHDRTYPKCSARDGARIAHSAQSDVRAWWPGCTDHEYGDPKLSPDAARSGPPQGDRHAETPTR